MNKSTLFIMGGALAAALLVALFMQAKLDGKDQKMQGVEVLVSKRKLNMGDKIKEDDVQWQSWPKNSIYPGLIIRSEQKDEKSLVIYGAPLRRALETGEPIVSQAVILDAKGASNFLSASISPGMRAVAVAVRPETAVAGFIGPGDYVDVILSYQPKLNGELQLYSENVVQNYASETVLSNVRVLAVDREVQTGERQAKDARTVTLEVDKVGAEALTLAQSMGSISFSLRRLGDKDVEKFGASSLTTDMSRSAVLRRVDKERQIKKTSEETIRVYSGQNIQNVPVRTNNRAGGDR